MYCIQLILFQRIMVRAWCAMKKETKSMNLRMAIKHMDNLAVIDRLERMFQFDLLRSSLLVALICSFISSVNTLSHSAQSATMKTMSQQETPSTIGFIGCGTIACAIATGLLTQTKLPVSKIYVSRRSETKSSALVGKFGEKVVVCDDNQEIVDSCDTLFLCVLPEQEEEVLKSLNMGKGKTLVSLVVRKYK